MVKSYVTENTPPFAKEGAEGISPLPKANPPESPLVPFSGSFLKGRLSLYLSCAWLTLVVLGALGAGLLPLPFTLDQIDGDHLAAGPGGAHLLGTDAMGRDIMVRLLFGSRVSLIVGSGAPLLGLVVGLLLGMPAAWLRGWSERLIMTLTDIILAFPALILLLVVAAIFGPSLVTITLGLGLLLSPRFVRVVRANTARFREREFVQAARIAGAGEGSILLQEVLPNIMGPLLVYTLVVTGYVIVVEGGLAFLGLSVPSPAPSWGGMIAAGRDVLEEAPHVAIIPMVAMFLTVLAVNIIGDKLRERYERS